MYPTPFTVLTHALVEGSKDAHGNESETWAAGVSQPVYGWAPSSASQEPDEVGRTAVVTDIDVLVPPSFVIGPHDRVTLNGDLYEVVGRPQDFNHGPFGFTPGNVVQLKRVEG